MTYCSDQTLMKLSCSSTRMNMTYSNVASYTVMMGELPHGAFRTLAAMCCFTSVNGLCYPNQATLAAIRGVSQPTINNQIQTLRALGIVIDLVPVGKKKPKAFQRGCRYFIPPRPGDQPPPLEVLKYETWADTRKPPDV